MGVNKSDEYIPRSSDDIAFLRSIGFETGKKFLQTFTPSSISSKIHRLMFHVADHFFSFGCARKGFTDLNETKHKQPKKGYTTTNHQRQSLGPQLLITSVRVTELKKLSLIWNRTSRQLTQ